mmetsp:Transcript_16322/g.27592  ORF Transcript_16322/g.27592 Transcript_16322/m.27592 type:complete len:141 (+) Transcript_16322:403-825(+)
MSRQYYEGASGIILVFDVTDRPSFDNLSQYWLPKISENADSNIELMLLGNKTDLINERCVSEEEANELLKTNPNLVKIAERRGEERKKEENYMMEDVVANSVYYEVSAKEQVEQVEKIFKQLLTNIILSDKLQPKILMEN